MSLFHLIKYPLDFDTVAWPGAINNYPTEIKSGFTNWLILHPESEYEANGLNKFWRSKDQKDRNQLWKDYLLSLEDDDISHT